MKSRLGVVCVVLSAFCRSVYSDASFDAEKSASDSSSKPVPLINVEWPFLRDDGSIPFRSESFPHDLLGAKPEYRSLVEKEDQFKIEEMTPGMLVAQPKTAPANSRSINLLDRTMSLRVENVSTWEALKALSLEISWQPGIPFPLLIVPVYWSYGGGPPEFFEDKCISIDAKNATTRSILLDIFSQAPVQLRYDYSISRFKPKNDLQGRLTLCFYRDGKLLQQRTAPERAKDAWIEELEDYMAAIKFARDAIEEGVDPKD